MQNSAVREMEGIFSLLKFKCGLHVEQYIAGAVASRGYSTEVLAAISEAKSKAQMEGSIKALLQAVKQN